MTGIKKLSVLVGLDLPYFVKGGFWLFFSLVASTLGGIFLSSLFARTWPKDVYGQYAFLTAAFKASSRFLLRAVLILSFRTFLIADLMIGIIYLECYHGTIV